MVNNETMMFNMDRDEAKETREILNTVYQALIERGYNPINQLVGYFLSGDPTYITNHKNARSLIRKIERDELDKLEEWVNKAIDAKIPVVMQEMTVDEAKEQGAIGLFSSKYGNTVKVYSIEGYSKEICGGPHAENTGDLGKFRIQKEQSSSSGVRRIKAVLIKD